MLKNVYKACFIALAVFVGTANSLEIRPFHELLFPTKLKITHDKGGNENSIKMNSDIEFMGGSEVLFSPEIPIRYGFGLGVKSAQQKGDTIITPAMLPLWGVITYDPLKGKYPVSPYVVARAGTLMPLTTNGNWWEKPLNFNVAGGIGAIFPYNIGFEVVYDYTSVLKSFKSLDTKYRVSSGRVALVLSVGFNIGGDDNAQKKSEEPAYDASAFSTETAEEKQEESQETSGFDYSGGAYDSSSETDSSTTSETTDYGYGYGTSEETPSEDTTASESTEPESTEPAAEESVAEETPAEPEAEPAAEPEPEPEAEPAPAPEPKPAAKKTSKKSSKKASKKSSKKSSKKASKKSKKKK